MQVVPLITYAALGIGLLAMLVKVFRYATAPEHMRWELYPVPHEKGRSDYGGSYLEELDWWTKERHTDMFNELKEMAEEIILLKGVFKHNRIVWAFSFPFHLGLYLCIGWLMFLLIGAIIQASGIVVASSSGGIAGLVHLVTSILGWTGLILAGYGSLGLFFWRLGNKQQRGYSAPIEYINLIFFFAVTVITLYAQATIDPAFTLLRDYTQTLITFSALPAFPALIKLEIVLGSLLMMYIPLTRMSHFVAKYFLYHAVRWNDEPNKRGSKIEARILELLNQKVGWSAPHIQTGQSWGEVVKEMKHE